MWFSFITCQLSDEMSDKIWFVNAVACGHAVQKVGDSIYAQVLGFHVIMSHPIYISARLCLGCIGLHHRSVNLGHLDLELGLISVVGT